MISKICIRHWFDSTRNRTPDHRTGSLRSGDWGTAYRYQHAPPLGNQGAGMGCDVYSGGGGGGGGGVCVCWLCVCVGYVCVCVCVCVGYVCVCVCVCVSVCVHVLLISNYRSIDTYCAFLHVLLN